MILAGNEVGPFGAATTGGAGMFRLPDSGTTMWGKVWVSDAVRYVDVPLEIPAGTARVEAAIWWPEESLTAAGAPVDTHDDIDLEVVTSLGFTKTKSNGAGGVFERVKIDGTPTFGPNNWKVRIRVFKIRTTEAHPVYWAVTIRSNIADIPPCP